MLQTIERFDRQQGTRLAWLHHAIAQEEYHRGQITVYERLMEIEPMVETVSIADVPAGTGMGSSGSFTVGLLHALNAHKQMTIVWSLYFL